jgi:DNA polymerase-4
VHTIGELARIPRDTLVAHFGPAHGHYLHEAAQGTDESPLVTHWDPRSMSRETTFARDTRETAFLRRSLAQLAREVAESLAEEGYAGESVTVKLRYADFDTHTHTVTLAAPTREAGQIRRAALGCFERFPLERRVRLLGVRVGRLKKT